MKGIKQKCNNFKNCRIELTDNTEYRLIVTRYDGKMVLCKKCILERYPQLRNLKWGEIEDFKLLINE